MNRHERRLYVKRHKVPFNTVAKNDQPLDKTVKTYCWLHPNLYLENPKNPTENDKKAIHSIELKPFKLVDEKTGKIRLGRACPRCNNTVWVSEERTVMHSQLEGYTDKTDVASLSGLEAA